MAKKEASAEIQVKGDARAAPLRKRHGEIELKVDSIPGFDTSPGDEFEVEVESLEELKKLKVAIENGDAETAKKYLKRKGD